MTLGMPVPWDSATLIVARETLDRRVTRCRMGPCPLTVSVCFGGAARSGWGIEEFVAGCLGSPVVVASGGDVRVAHGGHPAHLAASDDIVGSAAKVPVADRGDRLTVSPSKVMA